MRSHSSSDLKGACQDHKLTWPHVAQVKRYQWHQGRAFIFRSDHYLPSLHHLSKSDFRHHLILPVLISLSSLDLCFTPLLSLSSSRVISIFDKEM